jgi:hypothetical protein
MTYTYPSQAPSMVGGNTCVGTLIKKQRSKFDGMLLYFWWNIWKERNRRTFQHIAKGVAEVTSLVYNDVEFYQETKKAAITVPPANLVYTGLG